MAAKVNATANSAEVPEISRAELQRGLRDSSLTILDVLPEASYVDAHIPGALSIGGCRSNLDIHAFQIDVKLFCH